MKSAETDLFPVYDEQDLSAFAILMIHRAASRLMLTTGNDSEQDMRDRLENVKPGLVGAIDEVMDLYREWSKAKSQGATDAQINGLRNEIERRRTAASAMISN